MTKNLQTGETKKLTTDNSFNIWTIPQWSPDGSKIAFAHESELSNSGIYVINKDGTNLKNLTESMQSTSFFNYPVWSPDGSKIAFTAQKVITGYDPVWDMAYTNYEPYLYVMNADGSNIEQHISFSGGISDWY